MSKRIRGLVSIMLADVADDGGMAADEDLVAIGETVIDSTLFSNTAGTQTDIFVEEQDDPIESLDTTKGAYTLKWSTYNIDPSIMVDFFGGVAVAAAGGVPASWTPPAAIIPVEKSVKVTDQKGNIIKITRLKITTVLTWNLNKSKLGQIDLAGTILIPDKVGENSWSITYA